MPDDWLPDHAVIPGAQSVAEIWGELSAAATFRGRPRPVSDTWARRMLHRLRPAPGDPERQGLLRLRRERRPHPHPDVTANAVPSALNGQGSVSQHVSARTVPRLRAAPAPAPLASMLTSCHCDDPAVPSVRHARGHRRQAETANRRPPRTITIREFRISALALPEGSLPI